MVRRTTNPRQASPASPTAPARPQRALDPNWRATELLTLQAASLALGISIAGVYRLQAAGRVEFRRLAGRTLAVTRDVIAAADHAAAWSPSEVGAAARARRLEIAAERARA